MRKSTEYYLERNKLINEKLKKSYNSNREQFELFYEDLNDIKLIFKALNKLGYEWIGGYDLLDFNDLKEYYDRSVKRSGGFCIRLENYKLEDKIVGYWSDYYNENYNVPAKENIKYLISIYEELKRKGYYNE